MLFFDLKTIQKLENIVQKRHVTLWFIPLLPLCYLATPGNTNLILR